VGFVSLLKVAFFVVVLFVFLYRWAVAAGLSGLVFVLEGVVGLLVVLVFYGYLEVDVVFCFL
jgi:hypothetical protein